MKDYLALTKPRITWLILAATAIGFWFGSRDGWDWLLFLHTLAGTALIASGTAALNQWIERDADAKMKRTRLRPLPAGRLTGPKALTFGLIVSLLGFLQLSLGANWLTGLLGLFTLVTYLFLYTPLKRMSRHSTTVGAIPGAMPPLIGFAAAAGTLNAEAWALYAILLIWQFPHFYAIAWMYRDDYSKAGIRMLPVVEPDGISTAGQILFFCILLIPVSLIPVGLSMAGIWYATGALLLGIAFAWLGSRILFDRSIARARKVLLASVVYLPCLFSLLLLDRLPL